MRQEKISVDPTDQKKLQKHEVRIVFSKHLPFADFFAVTLFGFVVVREQYKSWFSDNAPRYQKEYVKTMKIHEAYHLKQSREMGYLLFYIWYVIEWLIRLALSSKDSYMNISFEQEAYLRENDGVEVLRNRKPYSWCKYIFSTYEKSLERERK